MAHAKCNFYYVLHVIPLPLVIRPCWTAARLNMTHGAHSAALSSHSTTPHGHRQRHRHLRRHLREDRRENVGVSFSLPQEQLRQIARVGRVCDDPREYVRVGVGVVEYQLYAT